MEGINLEQLKIDARTVKRTTDNHPAPFGSWFEVDVFLRINDKGYRVIPQFEVAGYFIDIVVEGMRGRLAIECDGDEWHGPDNYDADMLRQRTLERCGWTFWRIRGSEYYHAPDQAIASLWEHLDRLRIAPGGQDIEPRQDQADESHRTESETYQAEETRGEEKYSDNAEQQEIIADIDRSEMLKAVLSILPHQGKMSRGEAIRAAAIFLRDQGRIEFQRVRENGDVWNQFKSAINSGIRRGLLNGDIKTIWRGTQQDEGTILLPLITAGKEKGFLTYDEIKAAFPDDDFSVKEMDNLLETLGKLGIKIVATADEGIATEKEMPETKEEFLESDVNSGSDRSTEFKAGERVNHPSLGAGTVLRTEGTGEMAKVVVRFDTCGEKMLVVELAGLQRV